MLNNFQFPQINPLKAYFQSDALNIVGYANVVLNSYPSNQNERGFDYDFYLRNLNSWIDKACYFQPWQQGDKIQLQWYGVGDDAAPPAYVLVLLDKDGQIVKSVDSTEGPEIGTGSGVFIREAVMHLHDVPEGIYLPQIIKKQPLFGVGTYFFPCEPIHVKPFWKDTMLFKYKHSENAYGIFWETNIEMEIRMHAAFTKLTPDSEFATYENDTYDATLLSGTKYRTWQVSIGVANHPVAMYMLDKLEEIILCDSLFIEHKDFTRASDGKIEQVPVEKNPLYTANVNLREKINEADLVVGYYPPIVLGIAPTAAWFSVGLLTQTTPGTSYPIGKYFSGAKNFVDYLNSVNLIGVIDKLNTFFAIDTFNRIVLMTNVAAVNTAFSPGLVYTDLLEGHLIVEVKTITGETDLEVQFINSVVSTKYKYYWGDGTTDNGSGTGATESKTYPANKKFKAFLFWDQAEELYLNGSDQIIQTLEGELPLRTLIFDCTNNQLKEIKNNLFVKMGAYPSNTNLQLFGNKLTQDTINKIYISAYESIDQFDTPANIDVQSQTPIVGPSAELLTLPIPGITIQHD